MANEFIARKGIISLGDSKITGSLNISQNLTVGGTLNATFNSSTGTAISGAFTQDSSSLASRVADLESFDANLDNTYATDAQVSTAVSALNAATSSYLQNTTDTLTGDLTVTGTITAQEFHTEFVSASIIYQSGSTKFGDTSDDNHELTGSVLINGSVGIGTALPGYKLEVGSTSDADLVSIKSTADANNTQMRLGISGSASVISGTGGSSGNLVLKTYGSERMRIDTFGNVGIGTTSPLDKLHVRASTTFAGFFRTDGETYDLSSSGKNSIYEVSGTVLRVMSAQNSVDTGALINFNAYNSTNGATGVFIGAAAGPTGNGPANLVFGRRTNTTSWAESMRIDTGGNVGIGTTTSSHKLTVIGNTLIQGTQGFNATNETADIYLGDTNSIIRAVYDVGTHIMTNGVERLTVRGSTGRVGIGTTTPTRKLQIHGGSISSDTPTLRISSTDSSGTNKFGIEFYSTNGADVRGKLLADNNGRVYIDDNGGGGVVLQANGGTGNVGIGTTSPSYKAVVSGNNGSYWNGSSFTGGTPLALSIDNTQNGGYDSLLLLQQTDSGGTIKNAGGIGMVGKASWTAGNNATQISDMYFLVRNNSGGISERMRIKNDGNVGIGTTSPSAKLHIWTPNDSGVIGLYLGNTSNPDHGNVLAIARRGTDFALNDSSLVVYSKQNSFGTYEAAHFRARGYKFQKHDGTEFLAITQDGYVGIGTTSPEQKLHVEGRTVLDSGTASDIIQLRNDNGGYVFGNTTNLASLDLSATSNLRIRQGSSIPFYLNANGNLGIGTTSPVGELHVVGRTNTYRVVSPNLIMGNIRSNLTTTSYLLLTDLNDIGGYSMVGKLNAASYTVWNVSDIYVRKNYNATTGTATVTGISKSGCDLSVVDISHSSGRFIALKLTGNPEIDVMWTGYRLDELFQASGEVTVLTSGVTENSVYASY